DRGRYGQFLTRRHDVYKGWSVERERVRQRLLQVGWLLDAAAEDTHRLCDGGEVRIHQLGAEIDDARGLHLQLDEVQRRVVEDDHLDRQPVLDQRHEFAEHHCEAAVT